MHRNHMLYREGFAEIRFSSIFSQYNSTYPILLALEIQNAWNEGTIKFDATIDLTVFQKSRKISSKPSFFSKPKFQNKVSVSLIEKHD